MYAENTRLFLQWLEGHACTYANFFSLTRPERKYWLNTLYTRLKAYCYNNVYIDIIRNTGQHNIILMVASRGNRHMLAGNVIVEKPVSREPGWHIMAWNIPLPTDLDRDEAIASTLSDLEKLEIKPFQVEANGVGWDFEMLIGEEESATDTILQAAEDMMLRLLGSDEAAEIISFNLNPIKGLSLAAQQGLMSMLAIPLPIEKSLVKAYKEMDISRLN
jgi:hypothetical protein